MEKKWVIFFSQTGSEAFDIIKELNKNPDLIVLNKTWGVENNINAEFVKYAQHHKLEIYELPAKPSVEDYVKLVQKYKSIFSNCIITLHGYLRILPPQFCEQFFILNGHPGLITKYPELKGFNPQEKAFKLGLSETGSVVHKVTKDVDDGDIIAEQAVSIENKTLEEIYTLLHNNSTELWLKVLREYL